MKEPGKESESARRGRRKTRGIFPGKPLKANVPRKGWSLYWMSLSRKSRSKAEK